MPIESFISADSHVVEPADLWTTRMDRRFRDREKGDFLGSYKSTDVRGFLTMRASGSRRHL